MEQTFNDLWSEKRQAEKGLLGFVLWTFAETAQEIFKEHILLIKQGDSMKNILTNSKSATILSFILILPLAILFPITTLEIEPFYGFLMPLFTEADGYTTTAFGKIVMIVAIFLLPVAAFIVSFIPILRNVRVGNSIIAHPINFLLAIAIFSFIIMFMGGIIVDQYPCWIGVPNCD